MWKEKKEEEREKEEGREKEERREFFLLKQKTAYEIYQCDWSSDVCSSDLSFMNAAIETGCNVPNRDQGRLCLGLNILSS